MESNYKSLDDDEKQGAVRNNFGTVNAWQERFKDFDLDSIVHSAPTKPPLGTPMSVESWD